MRVLGVMLIMCLFVEPAFSAKPFNTDRGPFLQAQMLGKVSDLIEEEMNRWKVPGLAIAIIKEGQLIYVDGFGFRDPGLTQEVTGETIFPLASMTKAFTALTIGLLVDDERLNWDTPVSSKVPGFKLSNPGYTASVSFRDMLSHRTGLESRDSLWASGEYDVEQLFERLPSLDVVHPLRETYEYNNVLYIASAHMVGKITGTDWTKLVRTRILDQIGMAGTGFSIEELLGSENFSYGFRHEDGAFVVNELPGPGDALWYQPRGSGSMFSSARELANWMIFQLGDGEFDGKRIVSREVLDVTHTGQISLGETPFYLAYPGITDHAYALGWFVDSYRGHKRLHHGGASPMGYSNHIALYPEDGVGIVILSNRYVLMPMQLIYQISDLVLGLETENWQERFAEYIP